MPKGEERQLPPVAIEKWLGLIKNASPLSVPTGGDDADIGWRVIGHWMDEPQERTIAEVFHDDPRAAIDAAIRATLKGADHG